MSGMNGMNSKDQYKTVFISDIHIGFRWSKVDRLVKALEAIQYEKLYLVGDIIHDCENPQGLEYLEKILSTVAPENITYLKGNHDDNLEPILDILAGVDIKEEAEYVSSLGKKFYITHGQDFDFSPFKSPWIQKFGNILYDFLLDVQKFLGFDVNVDKNPDGKESFATTMKHLVKAFSAKMSNAKRKTIALLKSKDLDGIICGHTHKPSLSTLNGCRYYANCGDWVESCSLIAEDYEGKFNLLSWDDHGVKTNVKSILIQ